MKIDGAVTRLGTGAASLAEALAKRRTMLKPVAAEEIHDTSAANAPSAFEDICSYQRYVQLFNIERWLQPLGDATFDSELVSISRDEARALVTLHIGGATAEDTATAVESLYAVSLRLQRGMDVVAGEEGGCFVKTSCRSAKDSAEPGAIRHALATVFEQLPGCGESENERLVALSYASMELLRFSDARRVLGVFVRSERCWHDMELALAQDSWNESLVARRWVAMEPDMEFRCFVAGGRLTAVSQYRHLIYFPRLVALRQNVLHGLVDFLELRVLPRLAGVFPGDRYIVDLVVELVGGQVTNIMSDGEQGGLSLRRWWCIEVNPFFETTDACLFSWSRERAILDGTWGANTVGWTPEFRLRERPARGALSLVYGPWKEALVACAGTLAAGQTSIALAALDALDIADVTATLPKVFESDLASMPKPRSRFEQPRTMCMPDFVLEDSDAWLRHLHANGVVRIRAVLSPTEVAAAASLVWDWIDGLGGGARRGDAATWTDANWPGHIDKGFFCTRGGGHSAAAWAVRSSRRVHQAFASFWKTEDLLVSFDTFIAWRPWWAPAGVKPAPRPQTEGVHCDQNPHTKRGLRCVQGMVPLRPVCSEVGGLCVVRGSHSDAVQTRLSELFPASTTGDWLPLQIKHPGDELNFCAELITADPGDLILWDSRALHGGYVGPGGQTKADATRAAELARLSLAVCMVPAHGATEEDFRKRIVAFEKGITTTHWPLVLKKQAARDHAGSGLTPIDKWKDSYRPPELDSWAMKLVRGSDST